MKTKQPKTRTVLVKCMVVDSDGYAVDAHGNMTNKPWYEWAERRRSIAWLANPKNKKLWREAK